MYNSVSPDNYNSYLMINLYKQGELRNKNKSLYPANKSHTASMNLKVNSDIPS